MLLNVWTSHSFASLSGTHRMFASALPASTSLTAFALSEEKFLHILQVLSNILILIQNLDCRSDTQLTHSFSPSSLLHPGYRSQHPSALCYGGRRPVFLTHLDPFESVKFSSQDRFSELSCFPQRAFPKAITVICVDLVSFRSSMSFITSKCPSDFAIGSTVCLRIFRLLI